MKRKPASHSCSATSKRQKIFECAESALDSTIEHPVLSKYYTNVLTLRAWLLLKLDKTSKKRRKTIHEYGRAERELAGADHSSQQSRAVKLLDEVVVGTSSDKVEPISAYDEKDLQQFSQHVDSTMKTKSGSSREGYGLQMSEVRAASGLDEKYLLKAMLWVWARGHY